jgi:outer membrane receptor protein involved in Fe transport
VPGRLAAELSLSVYQIDMTDEIDFSFETFSNVNIGESRHRGVESGLKLYVGSATTAFVNYTLQEVTFQFGENEGNYVKAIPRDFISSGVRAAHGSGVGGSVTLNTARRIFLDDANTIGLPDYTTVALRLSYEQRPFTLFGEAFNLFDATYSTTGFPDPAGEGVVFYYPAAGRVLQVGLNVVL